MQKVLWVNLSSEFRKSGVQIYNNHLKYIASKNIKIFNLNSNNTNKKYKFYEKYISKYFKILRICKRQNLKYVVLPDESFLILGVFLYFKKLKPIIIIHDYKSFRVIKKLSIIEKLKYTLMYPFFPLIKNFHYVITVSKTSENIIRKKFKLKKIITIYNLFKTYYNDKSINRSKNKNKKIILNVGNDLTHKNFFVILKSLKKLSNVLIIKIGKPTVKSLRLKFKKYINLNNLNVKLINQVNDKSLYKYYKACDLYVNPSYHEGFGRTNIEALMSKKNVICSDIKINREILKKNVFYVKNFMSEDAWARSINKFLIENKSKKKSKFKNDYLISKNKFKYGKKLVQIFND